ncbi:hypothetical protein E3N88_18769 [Mikania micrantha]|uniref:Uncharacterized protein n=1 Tax=Mikania micrantha TaxID=192012 RepID=A0A5N6NNA8_9ASTR|nr:hypothetical protein E3N88_18769 [Mikania micrantha]
MVTETDSGPASGPKLFTAADGGAVGAASGARPSSRQETPFTAQGRSREGESIEKVSKEGKVTGGNEGAILFIISGDLSPLMISPLMLFIRHNPVRWINNAFNGWMKRPPDPRQGCR